MSREGCKMKTQTKHFGTYRTYDVPLLTLLMLTALLFLPCRSTNAREPSFHPANGLVPNEATAISIAKAVWIPIYGKNQIESEKPYKASINKGVWVVTGSLHKYPRGKAVFLVGGVAVAEISQRTGEILGVSHGK